MMQHPFIFSDEPKYRIARHLAFWTFWWLFQGFLYAFVAINSATAYFLRLPASLAESFIYLWAHIFLSYSLMYFVVPRFLLKQKYWLTALWVVILFLLTAAFSSILSVTFVEQVRDWIMGKNYVGPPRTMRVNIFLSLLAGLRGAITIGGLATAIKLMKYWYMKEQKNLQLQNENVAAQMQLLKAQIHPHFLFNTLNNIYSYTQNTSTVASQLVMGLSDMLRYMLYECNQPLVPLAKELKMLKDYITLETIRYDNKLEVNIDLPENVDRMYIAPLLLLPFVENCFKHGASNMLEQPWISLSIQLQEKTLSMKLVNGKSESEELATQKQGIGITNVEKRLQLLYSGKHELIITNDDHVFVVDLKVELERKRMPVVNVPTMAAHTHA
ncbi:MAG TPA: histidine kinase [Bacteroidia bacterium]|jgi:sensor histidine kinase YesM|nr:histidine kinase [Bacteroidia bacterium]